MADNLLRLKVDSQEYDAKIKRAAEGIQHFVQNIRESGSNMKESGILARAFLQELGNMETVATGTKQQLREMSNALTTLTQTYRELTDEEKSSGFGQELAKQIQILTERAGAAKDAMMDVEQSIKNAASDTRMFDQLAGGMTAMTATFQTATGAAKLFGIQMGDDVKVIADLQAAMAVTSGLQQLQNLLQKQSVLMQGVNALQAEFNMLAKANPYALLATAVAAVAGAYMLWSKNASKAEQAQKALNAELDSTKTQLAQIDKDTDFSVGIAQAAGKSWKAIHDLRLEAARTKLQLADMNYDKLAASGNASAEQMKQAAEMQKQAWDNVMKVLNEGTIHDIQKRNGTGPFARKGSGKGSKKEEDTNYAADSIMAQEKEVQRLTDQWNRASGAMRDGILKDLDAAKAKLDEMKNGVKPIEGGKLGEFVVKGNKMKSVDKNFTEAPINTDSINQYVSGIKEALKNQDIGSDLYNSLTEKLADTSTMSAVLQGAIAGGVQGADLTAAAEEMKQKLLEGDITDDAWQEFLDRLNEKIEDSDLKLTFDVDTKTIETAAQKNKRETAEMAKEWQSAGSAIQAVGQAMSQIEDPAAKVVGTVAQSIASIALGFAQATAADSKLGVFGWVAAVATGLATMVSTISAIHSATGYADGGIIKGNSFSGDNIMANGGAIGLNAGELILNRSQQNNLASQLEGGSMQNLNIDWVLTGDKLRAVMNNNGRRTGRGELVQRNRI